MTICRWCLYQFLRSMPLPVGTCVCDIWDSPHWPWWWRSLKCWTLTWLIARDDFMSFIRPESIKSYVMYYLSYLVLLCLSFLASLACTHSYHVMSEAKTDKLLSDACLVWLWRKLNQSETTLQSSYLRRPVCQSAESWVRRHQRGCFISSLLFLFIRGLLADAVISSSHRASNDRMIMHELERMRKEAIVAWYKVLSRYFLVGTEGNHETFRQNSRWSGRISNLAAP
jgi:hypothetical protein